MFNRTVKLAEVRLQNELDNLIDGAVLNYFVNTFNETIFGFW
jgi:NADPH-dependent 7-cyano-7-deazaguanine reductase QueF-like protein